MIVNKMVRLLFFMIIAGSFVLFGGCNDQPAPPKANTDASGNDSVTNVCSITGIKYSLDEEYDSEIAKCKSNVEISNTNSKYAQKWYDLADYYYNCILDSPRYQDSEKPLCYVISIDENWKEYSEQRLSIELERLQNIYGAGTIVPLEMSWYEYGMYRSYALEMYRICKQMFVECNQP